MNYEDKLEAALRSLEPSELEPLIEGIDLPRDKQAGKRISGSIARREKLSVSKGVKKKTAFIAVAAAAVIGCSAAAGAYVYEQFTHQKQNLTELYNDSNVAEYFDSKGLLDSEQIEVGHYIISKDTKVLFDGSAALFYVSVIPVDDKGREMTADASGSNLSLNVKDNKEDENGMSDIVMSGGGVYFSEEFFGTVQEIHFSKYYETYPVQFDVYENDPGAANPDRLVATLDYEFKKNVETICFTDQSGRRINLSELSIACFDGISSLDLTLEMKDGSQKTYTDSSQFDSYTARRNDLGSDYIMSTHMFSMKNDKIDPHNVAAIIIDGARFTPEA